MRHLFHSSSLIVSAFLIAGSVQAQSLPQTLQAPQAAQSTATAPGAPMPATMPATTRIQAQEEAKSDSGRSDPLAPVTGFKHFPSHDASFVAPDKVSQSSKFAVGKKDAAKGGLSQSNPYLKIPPPPPSTPVMPGSMNELPISELPAPPERPILVNSIKLTGIVGSKAIFSVTDLGARLRNNWPKALLLGAGDRFESISVVSVSADSAVLEENGERTDVHLERIR